jgi:hypothetical protein
VNGFGNESKVIARLAWPSRIQAVVNTPLISSPGTPIARSLAGPVSVAKC